MTTTPDPESVPVTVTDPVTLESFPDSRVQTIAAVGVVLGLLVGMILIGVSMVTAADLPGEFWPVIGTLAGGPLLLLQRSR